MIIIDKFREISLLKEAEKFVPHQNAGRCDKTSR